MVTQSNHPRWANYFMRAALVAVGCFIGAVGCCVLLYTYAFAAMISPDIIGWDRWMLILKKMLLTPSVVVVFLGVFAIGVGVAIVISSALGINARKVTFIAALATVLLFLAVLLTISM
jgi:hypothetical protein